MKPNFLSEKNEQLFFVITLMYVLVIYCEIVNILPCESEATVRAKAARTRTLNHSMVSSGTEL